MSVSPSLQGITKPGMNVDKASNQAGGENWRTVDRFDSSYWSGLDVSYFAENVQLEEVIQLSFQIMEHVVPYYGYADYVAHSVIHGQRVVTGELSMNFKRDGYIYSLMDIIRKTQAGSVWLPNNSNKDGPVDASYHPWGLSQQNAAADTLKSGMLGGNQTKAIVQEMYQRELLGAPTKGKYNATVRQDIGMFETREGGFDINIIFGARIRSEMMLRFDANNEVYTDSTTLTGRRKDFRVATGLKLVGVSISGASRMISDDGRPIVETYPLLAKDVRVLSIDDVDPGK